MIVISRDGRSADIEYRKFLAYEGVYFHDVYIDGVWQGSKRTEAQSDLHVDWILNGNFYKKERDLEIEALKATRVAEKSDRVKREIDSVSDSDASEVRNLCVEVVKSNLDRLKSGDKERFSNWVVGQIMKKTKKYSAVVVKKIAIEELEKIF